MKNIFISKIITPVTLAGIFSGCLGGAGGVSSSSNGAVEVEREAIQTDCRTIGYTGVVTLTQDVLGVPSDAVLYDGKTLDEFLLTAEGALGGTGINASTECSTLFHKTVSQLGLLSCHWMIENDAARSASLLPQGAQNPSNLLTTLTGRQVSESDLSALEALRSQITTWDSAVYGSLDEKQAAAVCAAVFAAISVQTL